MFLDESFSIAQHRDEVLRNLEAQLQLLEPRDRMAIVAFDGKGLTLLIREGRGRQEDREPAALAEMKPQQGLL